MTGHDMATSESGERQAPRFSCGPEALRPRERRHPRMPNATPALVEQRVVAFSLAHPGFGPKRVSAELRRAKWRSGRRRRWAAWRWTGRESRCSWTVSGSASSGVHRDVVWQYTAINGSAHTWAELHVTPHNPASRYASGLARWVAADLKRFGWELGAVMIDNGNEFPARAFRETVASLGAEHRFIRSGRPQTNGCVERVHGTILEECWKPAFAQYLVPGFSVSAAIWRDIFATTTRTAPAPDAGLGAVRRWRSSAPTRCGQAGEPVAPTPDQDRLGPLRRYETGRAFRKALPGLAAHRTECHGFRCLPISRGHGAPPHLSLLRWCRLLNRCRGGGETQQRESLSIRLLR